ncbi:maleylpyruvate isomerase family mycothiol-dependent enzyme [Pseudonocardia acidicola]|uniref:Maleylpyruvate isomerase family mycothiol-dependent enzyme n=1 Tax=Pseudonocardia acidicola TaxID=2724939 RepID=A0ABX1S6I6_9PSEU|nr:maleylpyruvate isomerase family mycothiol-dependent enzyme [Pseudonocardia acidicola]
MDTWPLIATERVRLVEALSGLPGEQWAGPSLCAGWSNRAVLAHIVATAEMTTATFLFGLAGNGFRFNRMVVADIERLGLMSTATLLERLRAGADRRNKPPGPVASMLLETVVHGEDIAYPTGIEIDHSERGLLGAADFARTAQPLVGVRRRIRGLALRANDHAWSTGSGPEVCGPLVPLLLTMCGRQAALDELTGDGVAVLRRRP